MVNDTKLKKKKNHLLEGHTKNCKCQINVIYSCCYMAQTKH